MERGVWSHSAPSLLRGPWNKALTCALRKVGTIIPASGISAEGCTTPRPPPPTAVHLQEAFSTGCPSHLGKNHVARRT